MFPYLLKALFDHTKLRSGLSAAPSISLSMEVTSLFDLQLLKYLSFLSSEFVVPAGRPGLLEVFSPLWLTPG